jgi:hypothetical protein
MSMAIMNGFSTESGERVFVSGGNNEGFFDDIKETSQWQRFLEVFGTQENVTRLNEIVSQLYGGRDMLTMSQFLDALSVGMDAGEFTRKVVEEPTIEEPPPTDKNGKPLSASQLAWKEHHEWALTHSSEDARRRAHSDPSFRKFREASLRLEMSGGVGDAVTNLNARPEEVKKSNAELVAFATEYHRTPSEQVRKLKRADSNPFGHINYNKNLDAAIAAGLI